MTNARFKEVSPGVITEMIAVRIIFDYTPDGLTTPEQLKATWWGREFLPVGDGHQTLGELGDVLETVLADHAATVLTIADPVTGQEVGLSTIGAVTWLKAFYDLAYNLKYPPVPELPAPPEPEP